jgi:DNA-binding MarR family transcriptional regulator
MTNIDHELNHRKGLEIPHTRALYNLLFTQTWLQNKLRTMLAQYEITYQQQNVLAILQEKHPEPLSSSEVKGKLLERNADLTRLCDRLESKKLIARTTNDKNRRQILISITPKGQELLLKVQPVIDTHLKRMSGLSEHESQHLSDLLDRFRASQLEH